MDVNKLNKENSSVGRTLVSKTKSQGFESLFSCYFCDIRLLAYLTKRANLFFIPRKSPKRKIDIINSIKICLKLIFLIVETVKKAYSSVVERTAHNGLVVGSNPTKLNFL